MAKRKVNVEEGKQGFQKTTKIPKVPSTAHSARNSSWEYEPDGTEPVSASDHDSLYAAFRAQQSGKAFGMEAEYDRDGNPISSKPYNPGQAFGMEAEYDRDGNVTSSKAYAPASQAFGMEVEYDGDGNATSSKAWPNSGQRPTDPAGNPQVRTEAGWMSEAEVREKYGDDAYLAPAAPSKSRTTGQFAGPNSPEGRTQLYYVMRRRSVVTKIVEGTKNLPEYIDAQEEYGWVIGDKWGPRLDTGKDERIV